MVSKDRNEENECVLTPMEIKIISTKIEKIIEIYPPDFADIIKKNKTIIIKAVNAGKRAYDL